MKREKFTEETLAKAIAGQQLNEHEKSVADAYERVFGSYMPMAEKLFFENEFGSEKYTYKDYVKRYEHEVRERAVLLSGCSHIFFTDEFYDAGGILFYGKKSIYPNTLVVVVSNEREVDIEHQDMGIKTQSKYLDRRMHFVYDKNIEGVSIIQHLCPHPACPTCSANRDKDVLDIPYNVVIETGEASIGTKVGDFEQAIVLVDIITDWGEQNKKSWWNLG